MKRTLSGSRFSDQFDRVKRYLVRVQSHGRSHIEYEDDLWSFFVHAWALKDWIRNDEALDATARKGVAAAAHGEWTLQIGADLANRTKHLVLDKRSRHDAGTVRRDVTVALGEKTSPIWSHHISLKSGETIIAQDLAKDVVQTWQRLLADFGIT